MSVKKMIEMYVRYELDERTWKMLYEMVCHGLISGENWIKFYTTCCDWRMTDDCQGIENGEGKLIYARNAYGFLEKVL